MPALLFTLEVEQRKSFLKFYLKQQISSDNGVVLMKV